MKPRVRDVRAVRPVWFCVLPIVAACGGAAENASQSRSEITELRDAGCASCEIELHEVALLGHDADPASVRPDAMVRPCLVARGDGGELLFSGPVGGGRIFRYDDQGRVAAVHGRVGQGPGEFGRNLMIWTTPGRIHVVDNSNIRRATLDADGRVQFTHRMPARALSVAPLGDTRLAFHGRGLPAAASNPLFARVDSAGVVLTSWGEAITEGEGSDTDQWVVARSEGDGFWVANGWRYEVHQQDGAGRTQRTLVRDVPWFPKNQEYREDMYVRSAPPSWLTHVFQDDDGVLWTFSTVPDLQWEPAQPEPPTPAWATRNLDMMIEAIDPVSAEVLASVRLDMLYAPACGTPMAYTVLETEAGDTRLKVVTLRLLRGAG